jgi:hypothetical protein
MPVDEKVSYLDMKFYLSILHMDQQGIYPASVEADFWFCLHPGCPNRIMRPFDLRIVKRDHSDHKDVDNFTSFHDTHIKLLAMVENGDLGPP